MGLARLMLAGPFRAASENKIASNEKLGGKD
jgi:hypothetical protein